MKGIRAAIVAAAFAAGLGVASAQSAPPSPPLSPPPHDMGVPLSGDPDIDFARGMIPHHEGAVDMAEALLKNGQDPELRKLAQEVIASQQAEIVFLKGWLAKHDTSAQTVPAARH